MNQSGNVSVSAAAAAGLVMILVLGLSDLGIFMLARARAQTGAHASALAAVSEMIPGGDDPGRLAAQYAAMNGSILRFCECRPRGDSATVSVEFPVRFLLIRALGVDGVEASAKAEVDLSGLGD